MAKFKPYELGLGKSWTLNMSELLPENHIVFFVESCVSELDTSEIESSYSNIGQRGLHPKLLLSVLFLGYIKGIRSGRSLAEACCEQISFIYISKGYAPKKTVINDFRKLNVAYFESYFQQFLKLFSIKQGDASTSIFDGSKIEANCSRYQSRNKAKYEKWLAHLEADILAIKEELLLASTASEEALKKNLIRQ